MAVAAPGLLGLVLGVGLFSAPAGAVHPKVNPHGGGTCTDSWKTAVSGQWTTPGDWSTGAVPTSSDNVCIKVAGTYKVTLQGNASANTIVVGGTSGKQTLSINGTTVTSSGLTLSAATGSKISADGVLKLKAQNAPGAGYALLGGGGAVTIANSGTFQTSGGKDSTIYLRASISNGSTGKVKINGITTEDGSGGASTITNKGAFSVGTKGNLTLTNASAFTQSAGSFTNNGIFTEQGGVFTQTAGTDSGNPVTIVDGSTLTDAGESGTFTFDLFNNDNLGGTIPSGQTVDIIGNPSYNTNVTLGANLTNDGTLEIDAQTTSGSGDATLTGPTFTVTNAGTFETEGGTVQPDYLRTNVSDTSTGKTLIDGITTDDGSGGATTLTNNGTLSVGDGDALNLSNGSGVTQTSTGTFEPTVDVAANKAYGIAGGAVTVAGTLDPTTVGTPANGSTYNVISGASTLLGTFSTVDGAYTVSYGTGTVTVKAT